MNQDSASQASIEDFRARVAQSLGPSRAVLLNLVDALAIGPAPAAPVDLALSPVWGYQWSSLYQALRRAGDRLALTLDEDDWLQRLRRARLAWLQAQAPPPVRAELGAWRVRILDATDYPRPQARTVEIGYVHGAAGMRPGHGLSLPAQRVGDGSWTLPLEIAWVPPEWAPRRYGVAQVTSFVQAHGWGGDDVLVVDAHYTVEPFLRPLQALGVAVLGRVRRNRVFYLPPPPYGGVGRPRVRGRRFQLNDQRTLPCPDTDSGWDLPTGGRCEVSRWDDVRLRQWPDQPVVLYRVVETRADGRPRYRRPLWLLWGPAAGPPPAPRQAEALYDERFSIEHSLRFMKQQLGLTGGQFNGAEAEARLLVWVELVATAFWLLWALRERSRASPGGGPKWWRSGKLTPGAVRRQAAGLLLGLGWGKPQPKPRGKSPGRARGAKMEPRHRYRRYRARAK